jgi:uncharacterized protein
MTPQEESMLNDLISRVGQTRLSEKDPDAEQLLNQGLGRNPDALYILAQTVLVQKYALEQAQSQLQQLQQQQAQQPARSTSFLGNLLGHRDPAPPPPPPPPPPQPTYGAPPSYGQPYGQPWGQPPAYGGPPPQSGGPSFLRSAATTAAGVAAGALAFEGVESLMHGFGNSAGLGGGSGFLGGAGGAPGETVINNYYDEPGRDREGSGDASDLQTSEDDLRDDDISDDQNLDDTSYDDPSSDDSQGGNDGFA